MSNKRIIPKGRKNLPLEFARFGRHLVYSEGTKTEPNYVNNIKKNIAAKYKVAPNDIENIHANKNSNNTIYLVNDAKKDVTKRIMNGEKIDHVWVFFDKDSFPPDDFNEANYALSKMNNSTDETPEGFKYDKTTGIAWHTCYSNEAFELWLCLYFDYINTSLGRAQLIEHLNSIPSLKKNGFIYQKNTENIHDVLISNGGKLENAIKFAKKLEVNNTANPSTNVHEFMSYFKVYMDK